MPTLKSQLARLPTRPVAGQPHLACQAVTDTVAASLFPGRVMTSNNLGKGRPPAEVVRPWPVTAQHCNQVGRQQAGASKRRC